MAEMQTHFYVDGVSLSQTTEQLSPDLDKNSPKTNS